MQVGRLLDSRYAAVRSRRRIRPPARAEGGRRLLAHRVRPFQIRPFDRRRRPDVRRAARLFGRRRRPRVTPDDDRRALSPGRHPSAAAARRWLVSRHAAGDGSGRGGRSRSVRHALRSARGGVAFPRDPRQEPPLGQHRRCRGIGSAISLVLGLGPFSERSRLRVRRPDRAFGRLERALGGPERRDAVERGCGHGRSLQHDVGLGSGRRPPRRRVRVRRLDGLACLHERGHHRIWRARILEVRAGFQGGFRLLRPVLRRRLDAEGHRRLLLGRIVQDRGPARARPHARPRASGRGHEHPLHDDRGRLERRRHAFGSSREPSDRAADGRHPGDSVLLRQRRDHHSSRSRRRVLLYALEPRGRRFRLVPRRLDRSADLMGLELRRRSGFPHREPDARFRRGRLLRRHADGGQRRRKQFRLAHHRRGARRRGHGAFGRVLLSPRPRPLPARPFSSPIPPRPRRPPGRGISATGSRAARAPPRCRTRRTPSRRPAPIRSRSRFPTRSAPPRRAIS